MLLSFFVYAQPQPPDTLWTKTYGGSLWCEGNDVQQTPDGGFIITGLYDFMGPHQGEVYLLKTNSNGDSIWARYYGDFCDDEGWSVDQTADGGYIITGNSFRLFPLPGTYYVYLIKTDVNGDSLWTRIYGPSGWSSSSYGNSVLQSTDGGYIVAGLTYSISHNMDAVLLMKTDADGDSVWWREYPANLGSLAYDVQQTQDGGYIVVGYTLMPMGAGGWDVYLLKTDEVGDTLWTRTYGGYGDDRGRSVLQNQDGGYIICGNSGSYSPGMYDVYIIRTDADGDTLWTRTYGRFNGDSGISIQPTTDGGYIIAGLYDKIQSFTGDVWVIKIDADGDSIWSRTVGGNLGDCGLSVEQTMDGGYIVTGYANKTENGASNLYLIRFEADVVLVENFAWQQPVTFSLYPSYPNPFNPVTNLTFALPKEEKISLIVYDIQGREVERIVDGWTPAGIYQMTFDASNLTSGIYFARLTAGGNQSIQKMLLLK